MSNSPNLSVTSTPQRPAKSAESVPSVRASSPSSNTNAGRWPSAREKRSFYICDVVTGIYLSQGQVTQVEFLLCRDFVFRK